MNGCTDPGDSELSPFTRRGPWVMVDLEEDAGKLSRYPREGNPTDARAVSGAHGYLGSCH